MAKSKAQKYYAVLIGRDGPQIYDNWDDCKAKVSRYPGAVHKSFRSKQEAENWIGSKCQPTRSASASFFQPHGADFIAPSKPTQTPQNVSEPPEVADVTPVTISLSPEQYQVFARVKAGRNVFFTGSAGTGKSVLLRQIIDFCGGRSSKAVAITASTGIAAVNIGGTTLHSWAGIGIGSESAKQLIGKFFGQPKFRPVLERWQEVKTLIIDEISMLDGSLFDKLEAVARATRRNDLPFGGIQLVLCGDFCQLPPVSGRDVKGNEVPSIFTFDAQSWKNCIGSVMTLTRVFRQKDQRFVDMLNEMRFGQMTPRTIEMFRGLSRQIEYQDGIEPTELFSTRSEVQRANSFRLGQLPGKTELYSAADIPGVDNDGQRITHKKMEQLLDRLICPERLNLKVGAQVMLIKNLVQGELVNGSVGQVVKFMSNADAYREQTEVAKVEGAAQNDDPVADAEEKAPVGRLWPVVRFIGGKERMIIPADFSIQNADGKMEAKRIQLPLILAWAISVHKSQGQTLDRVRVDLRRTFEKGQAYVALSRATTMEQLQVVNFDPSKVVAHPRVLEWYGVPKPGDEFDEFDEMENEFAMQAYHAI